MNIDVKHRNHYYNPFLKKLVVGAVFILAGVALLGFNMGFFPEEYRWIVFSWQTLLMVIGFISIVGSAHIIGGSVLIFIGAYFMLQDYAHLHLNLLDWALPALLIIIGISFLSRRLFYRFHNHPHIHRTRFSKNIDANMVNDYNIFNGSKQKIYSENFQGGSSTNIFGGCELDFTNSQLAEGENYFDITCIFGGMTLKVPDDWFVDFRVNPLFGGVDDKRYVVKGMTFNTNKKLIITGTLVFGGIEIKSN